jgi:hypothetical protein
MTSLNALLMSDAEVLLTLTTIAAVGVMFVGFTPDFARVGRTGLRVVLCAGLGMAAVAGLAWSSIPSPHVTAAVIADAGGGG